MKPLETHAPAGRLPFLVDAFLGSYSQILFSHSRWAGGLLVGATMCSPKLGLHGAVGVLLSIAVASALRFSRDQIRSGLYGYNPLLISLGMGALFDVTPVSVCFGVAAVIAGVMMTASLNAALGRTFNVPSLTLPFLGVFYAVLGAAPYLPVTRTMVAPGKGMEFGGLFPGAVGDFLCSLGAVLFMPRIEVGLLMLGALLVASRISVVLAALGYSVVYLLMEKVLLPSTDRLLIVLACNSIMTAIGLGGIWFVPSFSSFVFAAVGALVCALVTLGASSFLMPIAVPALILPFNVTVLLFLYAMRQRVQDGAPKAVDVLIGSPEEHLNYFRTRVARFQARYFVPFSPPFLGRWTCTQGIGGTRTHKGLWQHALDFEVYGSDGQRFRGEGAQLSDYYCYGLPILAPADGQVIKVLDGVPDNPVGDINTEQNWGNLVLLCHAPGLYSLLCHFIPGSIGCTEGSYVKRGQRIGACGNSGRSPVPHLHFHLQASPQIGSPTIDIEMRDVVSCGEQETFHGAYVPKEGERVRNIEPEPDLRRHFKLEEGAAMVFEVGAKRRREQVVADFDLYGNHVLRSKDLGATLYHDQSIAVFTIYDSVGSRASVLNLLHAAMPRIPFEMRDNLEWTDYLPQRFVLPAMLRHVTDFVSPFLRGRGSAMDYKATRVGGVLRIVGRSRASGGGSKPILETCVEISDRRGIEKVSVSSWGRTREAVRIQDESTLEAV